MSQDPIADTKNKLDDLEQRIHAARSSLGARGDLNDEAQEDLDRDGRETRRYSPQARRTR
jgi:hypothetical protein